VREARSAGYVTIQTPNPRLRQETVGRYGNLTAEEARVRADAPSGAAAAPPATAAAAVKT